MGDGSEIVLKITYYLTVQLLRENWKTYKYLLSVYTEYRNINNVTRKIQRKLNDTSQYDCWYSTHVQSLSYLVGEQVEWVCREENTGPSYHKWYVKNTSIPDQETCEIMDLMMQNGAMMISQITKMKQSFQKHVRKLV